ncbi:Oxygen-regulated invasion protein OrgB [Pandoraea morbifera]|uniref:Oxygen-regulated invasion protein OrgB n=2 Tax=Pandoraea morbifera TaxID=2508300 RepID=A0A5E4TPU1_9BURK|nr:Oxygen-regulated invasion protein OrgB [Pandoraea morbifera]
MQAGLETQRRDAMRLGYRDGVAAALGDVVAHLLRTEQAQRRWRGDLLAQVRELLAATSRHADTMLAVLDEVLDGLPEAGADAAPDAPLTLVLPLRLKVRAAAIRERVQAVCQAPLKIEYRTAGERISVHRAGAVIEYDPDDFVAHAEVALAFDAHPARDDLHALLAPALASLHERVSELTRDTEATDTARTTAALPVIPDTSLERYTDEFERD